MDEKSKERKMTRQGRQTTDRDRSGTDMGFGTPNGREAVLSSSRFVL